MKMSIKGRILIWVLLLQLTLSLAGCIAVLAYARNQQLNAFDADVNARIETVIANIEPEHGKLHLEQQQSIPPEHLFLVRDSNGSVVAKNGLDHLIVTGGARRTITFARAGTPYRGLQIRSFELQEEEGLSTPPRLDLLYAMPIAAANAHFHTIVVASVALALAFLFLSGLATWWAVARGLRPLHQLAQRADAIDANNWRFEAPQQASGVSELVPLTAALKDLTGRLKAAFERERRFFSDASHELKTSVAIQKSTLQLLDHGPRTITEYKSGVTRALEDTGRTERLVANMLSLGAGSSREPVAVSRLADSLDLAIAELQTMAHASQVKLMVCGSSGVDVNGDPDDLRIAFGNVLENAVQHSHAGGKVEVKIRSTPAGSLELSISDSGPGIPPEDLPHVFERFYRSDSSRTRKTGGFGLGLAIAKSLIERSLGSISMESTLGQGTCVFIQLKQVATKIAAH